MKKAQPGCTVRIGTWNTYWRTPETCHGMIIRDRLATTECDILCVTEGSAGLLPHGGHVIDAGEDWGCPIKKGRRKVLLWSRRPWTPHTHALGSNESHKGRFVAGTTETPSGVCLTVIGACIPWRDSHVSTCRKTLNRWQDHEQWLEGFQVLRCSFPKSRTVVLGDFNQKHPKVGNYVPPKVYSSLLQTFEEEKDFEFATKGELPGGLRAIDHIVHTHDLTLMESGIRIWPKRTDGQEKKLSDHFGVWGDFLIS